MNFQDVVEAGNATSFNDTSVFGVIANIDGVDTNASLERFEAEWGIGQFVYKLSFNTSDAVITDGSIVLIYGVEYAIRSIYYELGMTFAEMEKLV